MKSYKIFSIFLLWVVITLIYATSQGSFNLVCTIRACVGGLLFSVLIPYLFGILVLSKIFSYKNISKISLILFGTFFILGLIQFVGLYGDIGIIGNFFNFFNNKDLITNGFTKIITSFGLPRIKLFFSEPSHYANFIVLMSPIVYCLCFNRIQFFRDKSFNFLMKKLTFVLMIVNLILTQSPAFFFIAICLFIVFIIKKYSKTILHNKQMFVRGCILILFFIIILGCICSMNLSGTFLSRITKTFSGLTNINTLITNEESFGTRIVIWTNQFILFMQSPIFGIGYGNITLKLHQQLLNSPLPLTPELYEFHIIKGLDDIGSAPSMFFRTLTETGIVGFTIIYCFFINLIGSINKNLKKFPVYLNPFISGIKYFLILFAITSIYSSNIHDPFLWILIGLVQAMILDANKLSEKTKKIELNNG